MKNTLPRPASLASRSQGADRYLGVLLLASAALLVAGWVMPVMTIKTLLVFDDELSILEGTLRLLESGEILLFLLIFLFTVVFPAAKLIVAFLAWHCLDPASERLRRTLGWIEMLGKWSMLDVFVVALVIVIVKLSLVSDVTIHAGLYVFAAAVTLSMLTVWRITVHTKAAARRPLADRF